jgi:tight adherence protein B
MNKTIINIIIIQVIVILAIIFLISSILKQYRKVLLEKRFKNFALSSKEDELSFFDKLINIIWKLIHKISNILKKSKVLTNYSKRYERFISYEERNKKSSTDYLALKIFSSIIFLLISISVSALKFKNLSFISLIISLLIGFIIPDIILNINYKKRRKQISEDLLEAITLMNNSFKSGRTIMQAIEAVETELDGAIADEFKKIRLDISYGLSLDVVFNRFYERVKLEDAKYIVSSLILLNKTGGNIVKVFDSIEKSIYDKKKLREELNSLTASSVFVFRVLVCLPFIFSLIIYILNPTYFDPLFNNFIGLIILGLIIVLYITYILIIKKVLEVKI